jgi:geranylgeranyl diphosphate synthase type I
MRLSTTIELIDFRQALAERRDRVHAYLLSWPGIADFRPDHMRDAILSYVSRPGKGLRPTLLMLSCGVLGGDENQAIPAAAAVEVFHTWTLVHDDIIDRDATRRGHSTVHTAFAEAGSEVYGLDTRSAAHYGTSVAILAGDQQQSWSYALLCDLVNRGVPAIVVLNIVRRMAEWLTPELMEGEMLDVQFSFTGGGSSSPEPPSGAAVLEMLGKKTGALLEYSAWAGGTIGSTTSGGDVAKAETLGKFARLSGLAFQLRDDILGLTADEIRLGKPVGSDLREGKQTYVVGLALERASHAQRASLTAVLRNEQATPGEIAKAIEVIRATGALDDAAALAEQYVQDAISIIDELPPTKQRELLRAWANFLLSRDH